MRARAALAEGQDWQAPLAEVRVRLGRAAERVYRLRAWWPVFRFLLVPMLVAVTVFWVGFLVLEPYFPLPR
jgi:hypothetical protein